MTTSGYRNTAATAAPQFDFLPDARCDDVPGITDSASEFGGLLMESEHQLTIVVNHFIQRLL